MSGCDCCNCNSLIYHEVIYKKTQHLFFCPDCYWKLKAQFDTVIEAFLNEHNNQNDDSDEHAPISCKVEDMKKGGAK